MTVARRVPVWLALALAAASVEAADPQAPSGALVPPQAPGVGEPIDAEAGVVTVRLSARSYRVGQKVEATLANGLADTIYVEDFKTDCSLATLEKEEAGEWRPLTGCGLERLTFVLAVGSQHGRTIHIDPQSPHLEGARDASKPAFGVGTYRLSVRYRQAPGPLGYEPYAVRSEPFLVKP